ncbi:hypothetical protein [Rhodopirellula sp. P2]|uniref:hypothetical protein n=1 Tax=Rhodopirellula sp. P2 TaxID=2127060 RepID=UPI002368C8C6|nr:hypothetical protein [Rhodopirellula sp. P2]WDQ16054.1 hypothetical protein PSR62_20830 [Rhodopirellula sp. P2]
MVLNPYAPTTDLPGLCVSDEKPPRSKWLLSWLLWHLALIAASVAGAEYDIESIMFSGTVFTLSGIVLAIIAFRRGNRIAMLFGLSSLAFAILIVVLINVMAWNPRDADRPVCILIWGYALASVALAWGSIRQEGLLAKAILAGKE